mmetsp:Transcript_32847/g.96870  ORF Transcript_32847/g.96870 Transcript_32847/m.96870 type:complete len:356 (-) Transcript_32847:297-1364(-)
MVGGGHLVVSGDRLVGSILVLVLVLILVRCVVCVTVVSAAVLLLVWLMMRSALTEGRAPSGVRVTNLLIEVGVVAGAGRAGLLDGGTRIDSGTSVTSLSSPSPPSALAVGGGASAAAPAATATLHLSGGVGAGRVPPPALLAGRHDGGYRRIPRCLHGQSVLLPLAAGRSAGAATGGIALGLLGRQSRRGIFDQFGGCRWRRLRIALVGAVRIVSRIFFVVEVWGCVVSVESSAIGRFVSCQGCCCRRHVTRTAELIGGSSFVVRIWRLSARGIVPSHANTTHDAVHHRWLLLGALQLGQAPIRGADDSRRGFCRGRGWGVRVKSSTRCVRFQLILHVRRRCYTVARLASARPLW